MIEGDVEVLAIVRLRNAVMIRARREKQLSISTLAEKTGLSSNRIYKLEAFQYPKQIPWDRIYKLACVLDVPVDDIVPEKLIDSQITTTFESVRCVTADALREFDGRQQSRMLLESPDRLMEKVEDFDKLKKYIGSLSYREREILKLRYGLDGGEEYTLEEIARIFRVPRDRVRQVEVKALYKLQKQIKRERNLNELVESLR